MTQHARLSKPLLLLGMMLALPACNLTVGHSGCGPVGCHSGSWSAACYRPQWGVMGLPHGTPYQWESAPPSLPFGVGEEALPRPTRYVPRERRERELPSDQPRARNREETDALRNDEVRNQEELPTPRPVRSRDLPPLMLDE